MKGKELIQILEEQSPVDYACDWDNVGLLVGNPENEIKKIYIAVDATDEVIEEAILIKADMLLTHHPLIFKGLKRITTEDFIGRRIMKLIQKDMAYYAMHTNFDVMGMADLAAEKLGILESDVLDITSYTGEKPQGIGRIGRLPEAMSLKDCAKFTEAAFSLEQVKVFGQPDKKIERVAISPGSGRSEIKNAIKKGADVLITGDIDHHDGIDAVAQGLCIIDAGHYGLEHIFVEYMKEYLINRCEGLEIYTQKLSFPFWVC